MTNSDNITLEVSPSLIECGSGTTTVTLTVSINNSNIAYAELNGGNLSHVVVTDRSIIKDNIPNSVSTVYTLLYIIEQEKRSILKKIECTVYLCKKVLIGSVEMTDDIFDSIDSMLNYYQTVKDSTEYTELLSKNPDLIIIDQSSGQYGWIATPWLIESFTDASTNLLGSWYSNEYGLTPYKTYNSPYGDGLYYVYRTINTGLGSVTWNINSKE